MQKKSIRLDMKRRVRGGEGVSEADKIEGDSQLHTVEWRARAVLRASTWTCVTPEQLTAIWALLRCRRVFLSWSMSA